MAIGASVVPTQPGTRRRALDPASMAQRYVGATTEEYALIDRPAVTDPRSRGLDVSRSGAVFETNETGGNSH